MYNLSDPLKVAQSEHRPHSLIASRRFWQKLGSVHGVQAWGYAYDGGKFNREPLSMDEHREYWFRAALYAVASGDEGEAFRAAFILTKLCRPDFQIDRPSDYAAWHTPKHWLSPARQEGR